MYLIAPQNQTTTFHDLNEFQKALANVDYVIDDTPLVNFNGTGSYANWLSAGGFSANNQSEAFIANKNVYRTDRIINANGYSDWPIRQSARADLALSDVIHMVYKTYEPSYTMTWLRAYAQMETSKFVTTAVYPSCTDPLVSLDVNQCTFDTSSEDSSGDDQEQDAHVRKGLSTGGKIGIAVGVVVGVVLLLFIGLFSYRKCTSSQPKKTERTNFQYQENI
ncbi:hypothetical protein K501DRAFT_302211 [Backusella circina FSU 941]|nr:hypothetical protein K501DRAFT_302211 [Backusella circina FSU 941]